MKRIAIAVSVAVLVSGAAILAQTQSGSGEQATGAKCSAIGLFIFCVLCL